MKDSHYKKLLFEYEQLRFVDLLPECNQEMKLVIIGNFQITVKHLQSLVMRCCLVVAAAALTVCPSAASVQQTGPLVSIDAWQQPLKNVLVEISKQTSWEVVVDEDLLETTISGTFKGIELGAFLKRSLKGENLIVLYDDASKRVDVQSFGSEPRSNAGVDDPPPEMALYSQGPQAGAVQDQQSHEDYLAIPDSVEPLTGMTIGEITAVYDAEQAAYVDLGEHSEVIDPVSGMTLAEIAALPVPVQE